MPVYRIHRMKDTPRQHFRVAPHVAGAASVKHKDYEEDGQVEAASEYAAWDRMRADGRALEIGDLLETETGELRICKYIGFESASWWQPPVEPPAPETVSAPGAPETGYTGQPAGDEHA